MAVQCARCKHFDLRGGGDLAKYGFGRCPVRSISAGHTFSAVFGRECMPFQAAEPEVTEKRMAWLKAKDAL